MDGQDWSNGGAPSAGRDEQVFGHPTPPTGIQEPQIVPLPDGWSGTGAPVPAPRRSSRLRWAAVFGVVLAVVLAAGAAAYVIVGSSNATSSAGSAWAPQNSIVFMSVRTDLPGDQRQKLADLLHTFPGFADRAQFDNALDEIFNKVTSMASPDMRYTSAFKPWFSGEIALAATSAKAGQTDGVVILSIKDRAKAEAWLKEQLDKSGSKTTSSQYAGETINVGKSGSTTEAYAFTNQVLLIGTESGVKASLDTKSKGGLDKASSFQTAMKAFSGERIASFYLDYKAILDQTMTSGANFSGVRADDLNFMRALMPTWVAGSVRAESDRLVIEEAAGKPANAMNTGLTNESSDLARVLPSSTVAMFDIHSIGKLTDAYLTLLDSPSSSTNYRAVAKQVRDALTQIGGLSWMGDGAVAVTLDGKKVGGGIVLEASDAATAKSKTTMVTNLLTLGLGKSVKASTSTYKGVSITSYKMASGAAGMSLTDSVAIANKDNLIIGGYGDAFVKGVIDATADNSLASKPSFKKVMDYAGAKNTGSVFVDLGALDAAFAKDLTAAMAPRSSNLQLDVPAYLAHFDALAMTQLDGNPSMARIILTVK